MDGVAGRIQVQVSDFRFRSLFVSFLVGYRLDRRLQEGQKGFRSCRWKVIFIPKGSSKPCFFRPPLSSAPFRRSTESSWMRGGSEKRRVLEKSQLDIQRDQKGVFQMDLCNQTHPKDLPKIWKLCFARGFGYGFHGHRSQCVFVEVLRWFFFSRNQNTENRCRIM